MLPESEGPSARPIWQESPDARGGRDSLHYSVRWSFTREPT
jgi:hypothetical protein